MKQKGKKCRTTKKKWKERKHSEKSVLLLLSEAFLSWGFPHLARENCGGWEDGRWKNKFCTTVKKKAPYIKTRWWKVK